MQMRERFAILISDKIDYMTKTVTRGKKGHFIMIIKYFLTKT